MVALQPDVRLHAAQPRRIGVRAGGGGPAHRDGRVRAWEPPHRLVFGWRQATFTEGQDTEVEVRFEAVGEETRVTVEHRGWDSVPAAHVARHNFANMVFLQRHGEWWRELLEALGTAVKL
jgi:uncharacterized protein YndB with AHSA1/START domain